MPDEPNEHAGRQEDLSQLSELLDNLPGMAYRCPNTPGWPMTFVSEGCRPLTGYTPEELTGGKSVLYSDLIHPEDRQVVWNTVQKAVQEGESFVVEYRLLDKEGAEHWIWERGRATGKNADGATILQGFISDITDRKRAEEALQASEQRLNQAQRISGMGDFTWVPETGEVTWSDAMFELLRYDRSEVVDYARVNAEIHHPEDLPRVTEWLDQAVRSGAMALTPNEYRLIRKDGTIVFVRAAGIIERKPGRPAKVFGTVLDITERMRAETETKAALAFLDRVVDMSPFAMWIADPTGTVYRTNRALRKALNLTDRQIVGKYNVLNDENLERQGVMLAVKAVFDEHKPARFTIPWQAAYAGDVAFDGGRDLYIDVSMFPVLNAEGQLTDVVCQWVDITERKKAEEERDRLFNLSLDMFCIAGFDGRFKQLNPAWERTLGWPVDELEEKAWLELVHPDDHDTTVAAGEALSRGEMIVGFHNRYQAKDGSWHWLSWNSFPLTDARQIFAVARDVTEQKQVKKRLATEEARYRNTLDTMMEGCQIIGRDWRYLYVNDAVVRQGRNTREHLLGRTMMEAYPGIEETPLFQAMQQCMEERLPLHMENEFVFPDGKTGWFELSMHPVPEGVFMLSLDISKRKQIEAELVRHQKQLEDRVAERTRELQTLVNAMAGREVRMAELKEEIAELHARLEEKGITPRELNPRADSRGKDETE